LPDSALAGRIRPQNHEPDSRGRPMDGFPGRIRPQNHERFPKLLFWPEVKDRKIHLR
jgi:hypothetical protein